MTSISHLQDRQGCSLLRSHSITHTSHRGPSGLRSQINTITDKVGSSVKALEGRARAEHMPTGNAHLQVAARIPLGALPSSSSDITDNATTSSCMPEQCVSCPQCASLTILIDLRPYLSGAPVLASQLHGACATHWSARLQRNVMERV